MTTSISGPSGSSNGKGHARVWTAISVVAALAAAGLARKLLSTTWRATTGKRPPANPADPNVRVGEAVLWAAASGVVVGLARMLAQRNAARYFAKTTGALPPQLQDDDQDA